MSGSEDRKPSCPSWGGGASLGGLEGILENWGVADPAGGQVGSAQQTRDIQHWVNVSCFLGGSHPGSRPAGGGGGEGKVGSGARPTKDL